MDMAKAAVLSSIEYDINRHCLYNGNNSEFIAFLKQNNVNVILHETSFKSKILELVEPAAHPTYLGAFLRIDIPLIINKLNLDIDYYLYTDCDIIFNRDPSEVFLNFFPSGIGASGENKQNQVDMFNSGVMWCNQKKMLETYQDFYNFVVDKKFKFTSIDQGALNEFYTHEKFAQRIHTIFLIQKVSGKVDNHYLNERLFPLALKLSEDPVPNIRFNFAKLAE